jgi:hypothetical protein
VAHVGGFSVGFTFDRVSVKTASPRPNGVSGPMRCQLMALCGGDQPIESSTDADGHPLETQLADIAVAIVVDRERVCRSSAEHHREWVIKRKAEIVEEERRKEAERCSRFHLDRRRLTRLVRAFASVPRSITPHDEPAAQSTCLRPLRLSASRGA